MRGGQRSFRQMSTDYTTNISALIAITLKPKAMGTPLQSTGCLLTKERRAEGRAPEKHGENRWTEGEAESSTRLGSLSNLCRNTHKPSAALQDPAKMCLQKLPAAVQLVGDGRALLVEAVQFMALGGEEGVPREGLARQQQPLTKAVVPGVCDSIPRQVFSALVAVLVVTHAMATDQLQQQLLQSLQQRGILSRRHHLGMLWPLLARQRRVTSVTMNCRFHHSASHQAEAMMLRVQQEHHRRGWLISWTVMHSGGCKLVLVAGHPV
mmetsp:Transcript_49334/g.95369  ORF Transcript_49334/g.95369 Transcript_49334/m.95369 type:complete len:266 (-) Transcript_49334:882-1679(-)